MIGYVGDSGNARGTPPHLHYGVYRWRGGAMNPYSLLANQEAFMKRMLLAFAFLLVAGLTPIEPVPPLAIEVEVAPSVLDPIQLLERKTPRTFTARALIRPADREGVLYVAPEVVVSPGKRETVTEKTELFDVRFTVAVSEKRDRAKIEVVIARGDQILHVQKSDVVMDPTAVERYRRFR